MNKKIEAKIDEEFPTTSRDSKDVIRWWLGKQYHRWITFGCSKCWREGCKHPPDVKNISTYRGFKKMSEYCYEVYWNHEN